METRTLGSERVIGKWLAKDGCDEVVLASKCRFRTWAGANGTAASRAHIMRAADDVSKRVQGRW